MIILNRKICKKLNWNGDTPTDTDHILTRYTHRDWPYYNHWPYYNEPYETFYQISDLRNWQDHHKIIMIIFCSTFARHKPKTFYYYCYKKFNLAQFQMELKGKLDVISNNSFDLFLEEFKTCFNNFVPLNEKIIRLYKRFCD